MTHKFETACGVKGEQVVSGICNDAKLDDAKLPTDVADGLVMKLSIRD